MTEERNEFMDVIRGIVARWYVVLAVGLIAALAAVAYARMTAPAPTFTAVERFRVQPPSSLQVPPTPDTLVFIATSSATKASAAASLGIDAGKLSVSAVVDPKDTQVVDISTTGKTREEAKRRVEVVGAAAKAGVDALVAPYAEFHKAQIQDTTARLAEVEKVQKQAQDELDGADPARRAMLLGTIASLESQAADLADRRLSSISGQGTYAQLVAPMGGADVSGTSRKGRMLSQGLRGLLIGLFLGALAVGFASRPRR